MYIIANTFTIDIVGTNQSGKSTFIELLKTKTPAINTKNGVKFYTNRGIYVCTFRENVDDESNSNGRIIIVDYDISQATNYIVDNVPFVVCGNKIDDIDRCDKDINKLKKSCMYYNISCKANYNTEKPILYLLRRIVGYDDIYLLNSR